MNKNPKVLILATTSYAGMGPYVVAFVNSFKSDDNVCFFLVERKDRYYSRNIKPELHKACTFYKESPQSNLKTLSQLLYEPNYSYATEIRSICSRENIEIVHVISSWVDIKLAKYLSKSYNLLTTVHDLSPHEAKKIFYKEWRQRILYNRVFKIFDISNYLFTNSINQLNELKYRFPYKKLYYAPFPSLVTEEISNGNEIVPELEGIKNYILFFGRIEFYKGIHLLYEAWYKCPELHQKFTLVIAGKGDLYLDKKTDTNNVIFINRYIKDGEIKALYKNAIIAVYPYISATQSGVLSIACHFQTPVLTSDIPYFANVEEDGIGLTFKNNDINALTHKMRKMLGSDLSRYKKQELQYYKKIYNEQGLRDRLMSIYSEIKNQEKA